MDQVCLSEGISVPSFNNAEASPRKKTTTGSMLCVSTSPTLLSATSRFNICKRFTDGLMKRSSGLEVHRTEASEFPRRTSSNLILDFCNDSTTATLQIRLFKTAKGYIGLGPPRMEQGDQVCIVFGCKVPLLLREVYDAYLLVGDCYVFGMMQGEMIEELENGRLEKTTFILR